MQTSKFEKQARGFDWMKTKHDDAYEPSSLAFTYFTSTKGMEMSSLDEVACDTPRTYP